MSAGLGSTHNALTTQQKTDAQGALGLGTAATQASTAFATAAQGAKADSALQNVAGMTTAFNAGTSTEKAAFRSAVQGDGITHEQARSGSVTGTHQEVRVLTNGLAIGQRVRWWQPGAAAGFWGYDISPSDRYTG